MSRIPSVTVLLLLCASPATSQADADRDGDGLTDFREIHKHLTDPAKKDSDGDGVPDGDWRERREYQYTVRTVVQVMRPVTIEWLEDDHQDARVLDETPEYVELEVIHYPFTTVAGAIDTDAGWRKPAAAMKRWLESGPTADWTPAMREKLVAALKKDGIDPAALGDRELVERASRWLCNHAKNSDQFTTFVTAFDAKGRPFIPEELKPAVPSDPEAIKRQWERDVSARGMFEHGQRGSCSASAIYLNGCLRALGIPTRIVLCIPVVDANDAREIELLDKGLTHHELRGSVLPSIRALKDSWASHTFNEVFVGGRWRRLNFDRLGQDIRDPGFFGLMTHVATFSDWADARMPETIGKRQTLRRHGDVFGGPNPYSTIALRDAFGVHARVANPAPAPLAGRITAVSWGDGADAPPEIREWFRDREVFGLTARIEGPKDPAELKRFLAEADLRVLLVADGKPTLGVGLDSGSWWYRKDHALVVVPFGGTDRRDHDPSVRYRFVPRNDRKDVLWKCPDGLSVPPRE